MKGLTSFDVESNFVLFIDSMACGVVQCDVLTNQRSETNLMPITLCNTLKESDIQAHPRMLRQRKAFGAIGVQKIVCEYEPNVDLQINIRHGTAVLLRQVTWRISRQTNENLIIRRPLLEKLGIRNKDLLLAACVKHGPIIYTKEMETEEEEKSHGKMLSLLEQNIGHSSGAAEDNGLENREIYVYIWGDTPEELDAKLAKRIQQGNGKEIS